MNVEYFNVIFRASCLRTSIYLRNPLCQGVSRRIVLSRLKRFIDRLIRYSYLKEKSKDGKTLREFSLTALEKMLG